MTTMWFSNPRPDKPVDKEQAAMIRGLSFRVGPTGEMTILATVPDVYEAQPMACSKELRLRIQVDRHGIPESMAIER